MRINPKIVAPLGVVGGAAVVIAALIVMKPEPEKKEEAERPVTVFTDPVRTAATNLIVTTQGEVRARTEIDLIPQVSGRIVSVSPSFSEGGAVSPGSTVLQIDPTDYRLNYIRAEAAVADAKLQFERMQADAEIVKKQWDNWVKDGKPTALALRRPQLIQAQTRLRAAEAELEAARLDLTRTRLTVPFHGRITDKKAGVGQVVAAGTPLGKAFATDVAEVRLPLTDSQLAALGVPLGYDARGGAGLPVTFSARIAGAERVWQGHLTRIDADLDSDTRLIYAIGEVRDPYGKGASDGMPFAKGMFVTAKISGKAIDNALVMPRSALRGDDRVFVVERDSKLTMRKVIVLNATDKDAIVSAGVSAGERVVTSPVKDGMTGHKVAAIARDDTKTATAR